MTHSTTWMTAAFCIAVLTGCGGGGTGGGDRSHEALLSDFETRFGTNPELAREWRLPSGSARYDGAATFNLTDLDQVDRDSVSPSDIRGYVGAMRLNVNFDRNGVGGRIDDFEDFRGRDVSGSVTISGGRLTGRNRQGLGDGLRADADGRIDGRPVNMDVEGSFVGGTGGGVALWFDDPNRLWGGVAVGIR